ncbi:MAG: hypothetical protein VKM34_08195 [Cyanobacteriota bacterium]|nr:hypothetical protein [Cyanobacteriota bacterium]
MTPQPHGTPEALIGLGVAVTYELIAYSKLKDNSVLQLVLHMLGELFPYELKRREPPTRENRPRLLRSAWGGLRRRR